MLCVLWGAQLVTVKVAANGGLPAMLQAGVRSLFAAVLVAGWMSWRTGWSSVTALLRAGSGRVPGLLLSVSFAAEFLLIYPGLHLTTASRGVLFLYTAPFFTALAAHFFLPAERLRARQMLGLLVAFSGVAIAFGDGLFGGGGNLLGDAMCAGAAVLWGVNTVLVKASPGLRRTSAAGIVFYQLAGSAPVILIGAAIAGELNGWPDATALAWACLFYQTVIVAFASYLVWFWLITVYPATQLSGFTFLTPLFGILAGGLVLSEPLSWALFAGLGAIAVGMRLLR